MQADKQTHAKKHNFFFGGIHKINPSVLVQTVRQQPWIFSDCELHEQITASSSNHRDPALRYRQLYSRCGRRMDVLSRY